MNKKYLRVIKEIQSRIPQELLMRLTKIEKQGATMKQVFEEALKRPDSEVSPRKKRALQAIIDSGRLDREVEVVDVEIEKEIDRYFAEEIAKAVKLGRLPKEAPKLETLKKKGNKYARKQEKRLRAAFNAEASDVVDSPENDPENEAEHTSRASDDRPVSEPSAAYKG